MSEDYQEFEDDFIFQLPEMVSSLRKEIFFFEPEPKKDEIEKTRILADRKKDKEEIKQLREELSNQKQRSDEEMLELTEKLASSNFELEQAKTRLKNQSFSKIRASTEVPKWTSFEFATKKKGAKGPSKSECIRYYSEM